MNTLRNAPNVTLTDNGNIEAMIFKDCSWRSASIISGHENLLKSLGKSDSGVGDTIDIGILL